MMTPTVTIRTNYTRQPLTVVAKARKGGNAYPLQYLGLPQAEKAAAKLCAVGFPVEVVRPYGHRGYLLTPVAH